MRFMSEIDEVVDTLDRLNNELQDLLVRGLRVCGPEHLGSLRAIHLELIRVGAEHLAERLSELLKGNDPHRPPLFGLLHFDRCRFLLQPLPVLNDNRPEYLTISNDKIDQAALLKTLKF